MRRSSTSEGGSVPTIKQRDRRWMVGTSLTLLCPPYETTKRSLLFHARFMRGELVDRRAELAGHHHLVVLDHLGAVFRREAFQHRGDRIARAGALRAQGERREHAHAALVKQPVQQAFA